MSQRTFRWQSVSGIAAAGVRRSAATNSSARVATLPHLILAPPLLYLYSSSGSCCSHILSSSCLDAVSSIPAVRSVKFSSSGSIVVVLQMLCYLPYVLRMWCQDTTNIFKCNHCIQDTRTRSISRLFCYFRKSFISSVLLTLVLCTYVNSSSCYCAALPLYLCYLVAHIY